MTERRRFPPPWSIEERQESFIVKDANGEALAYAYLDDERSRRSVTKRLAGLIKGLSVRQGSA
jgi:hypothetical protein